MKNTENCSVKSGKIIQFPYSKLVSENDINSLFLGLVKLVKKNALSQSERYYAENIRSLKQEVAILKLENELLKTSLKEQTQK